MAFVYSSLSHLTLSDSFNYIEAKILYHNIVIQSKNTVHLLNIKDGSNGNPHTTLNFKSDIVAKAEQKHLLWLLLKSGELNIINLRECSHIVVIINNYKIRELHCIPDNELFLVSESGDFFVCSLAIEDIDIQFKNGVSEISTDLLKTSRPLSVTKSNSINNVWKGLFIYNEQENLTLKCPLTNLNRNIVHNKNVKYILPWNDLLILSEKCSMWIINPIDASVLFVFPSSTMSYYPVEIYNQVLYYLTWRENEIQICCAWNAASPKETLPIYEDSSEKSIAGLSSQETLKQQLLTQIEIALLDNEPTHLTTQLLSYFEKIEDYTFLINAASKLCQHNLVYKSILYSLQNKMFLTGNKDFIHILTDLIIKVDLLEYISFKGNKNYEGVSFYEKQFVELCIIFIEKSDLDLASICWLKYTEVKLHIDSDNVISILSAIPYNIKMKTLIMWLKNFAPSLLEENPFYIDHFVKWTVERVFNLEHSGYWPKIGLKFIEEIITVLELSLKMVSVRPISMDELDSLKDQINYIIELKENYKINMLLSELSSQSPNEVAIIMLRRCYSEDLQIFLQGYLSSYSTRHLFELDDTLRTYIESEAAISGGGVDGFRLKILLDAFRSTTKKLDCLLQVLKLLDVPWDSNVLQLAVAAASSSSRDFTVTDTDRTLALEIQKEFNFAKVKVVLKKYNFPLTCRDYSLVLNKITSSAKVDLDDLNIICNVTNIIHYGSVLYIDKCLSNCETKTALNYFNNLSSNNKKIIFKAILNKYEQIVNSDSSDSTSEKNYLDFLKGTSLLSDYEMIDIENLYILKNSFNVTMTIDNIYDESSCQKKTNEWLRKNARIMSSAQRECITKLTRTSQSSSSILLNMLRRTPASDSVRTFLENLIISAEDASNKPNTSALSSFEDGCNSTLLINCFHTLIDLIFKCDEDNLHILVGYLSILNALINGIVMHKHLSVAWKFQYIYLPISSITSMNNLIKFFDLMKTPKYSVTDGYILADGYDFVPLKMISYLLKYSFLSENATSQEELHEVQDKVARKLLSKVITYQELDELILTSLLLILSSFEGENNQSWLLDILRGQSDVISQPIKNYLSTQIVRRIFLLDDDLPANVVSYPPQHILKIKFNINLEDIALPDNSDETWDVKVILFCVLRQYPNTDFDRLVELCRTLGVTINDGLTLQMISLLSTWELKYKLNIDELNCRQMIFENDEKNLISKCLTIWENVERKDLLIDILTDFWKNGEVSLYGRSVSINPYYYEVYMCIYYLLYGISGELRNIKEYLILIFLKDYKRISTPKQYEYELFSVKGMFPEIGYYRLPFHLFMRDDKWSNLKSEITLETYERWLPVVGLLSLDSDSQTAKDMICSNALKQTMTTRKRLEGNEEEGTEPWRLITREEPLLRAAHKCVRHIANMEWAGACLFYVLQGCARGADQVAAAHLCYQFAQRWAAVQPGNRAVRQMERLHSSLSTRHALHKINWACEEFIRLSTEPSQLIRALYLHPAFVEKMSRHDVNRAANEIADKNGINISSIRIHLLENILERTHNENSRKTMAGLNNRELKTAKYILKATCPKMGAIYLSRIAFDDDSDHNKGKKLRALQCLMSVVETDTAVKVTNREREALWNSLVELIHIVSLENIEMPWVVATFTQDKCRAIELLLQVSTNIEALKIAAELGRKYGNIKIVSDLLPLLLRAGLYDEMTPLLLKLSAPPNDFIYTAWRAVIITPFQQADHPITERQKIKCVNAINLLPVCPVIKDEDLVEIWKNCVRCKCFGVGCLVLPYMSTQTRHSLSELQRIDKRNLIASLKNLHAETYLISGAMHVIENMSFRGQR
ncbi:unnamed protein product [Chilo suppressalis]|uniref:RZZ complex subunit KNTC1/ROD C-terminal domain-containing protein n=1 Tax=Chilo suppressalis TaxID=168631 RepID=A0ABN8LCV8_CHISP|nr:unnamed protein product [Chilo suppressalis]